MSYTLNLAIRDARRKAEAAEARERKESLSERYGRAIKNGYTGSKKEFEVLLRDFKASR